MTYRCNGLRAFSFAFRQCVACLWLGVAGVLFPCAAQAAVFYPEVFQLSNGVQVVVVRNALSPAVAQMVIYKIGSIDEVTGKTGLAHYLEHLMFKGTSSVPDGKFSEIIAEKGGSENAFTSFDYTGYHEVVASEYLGEIMQLEADRMANLNISPQSAAPELGVVLDERHERTDNNPQGKFREKVAATLYGNHPYGRPVIGWREDVETETAADATAFYKAHCAPNNAVVVISGNVQTADVMRLAAATYGRVAPQKTVARPQIGWPKIPTEKQIVMKDGRIEQPYLQRLWVVPSYSVKQASFAREPYALEVLQEVLDGGEVGLLYKKLVNEKKLAVGFDVGYEPQTWGPASFDITLVPQEGVDVNDLEKELAAVLRAAAQKGISPQKVNEAKKRLTRAAVFARDSLMAPCHVLGQGMVTGQKLSDIERWPANISAVKSADVNRALRSLLKNKHTLKAVLMPDPAVSPEERKANSTNLKKQNDKVMR